MSFVQYTTEAMSGSPDTTQKARSRLSPEKRSTLEAPPLSHINKPPHFTRFAHQLRHQVATHTAVSSQNFGVTLVRLLILATAAGTSIYVLTSVQPHQIANLFFFNSYLPLHLSLFILLAATANLYIHPLRRAVLLCMPASILLFLYLQQVELSWIVILAVCSVLWASEAVCTLFFKK